MVSCVFRSLEKYGLLNLFILLGGVKMQERLSRMDQVVKNLKEGIVKEEDIPTIRNLLNLVYGEVKSDEIYDERANEWPINLLRVIDGDGTGRTIYNDETLETLEPRIDYVLRFLLTESEKIVIYKRFKHHESLFTVGEEMNLTRERVRQIEQKALRKLRHPSRRCKIFIGVNYDDKINELRDKVELKEKELAEKLALLRSKIDKINAVLQEVGFKIKVDSPEDHASVELLNLSKRSYNCLKRHGTNTIKELTLMTKKELSNVRNLGNKGVEEIIDKLEKLGYSLKTDEDYSDFTPSEAYHSAYVC